MKDQRKIELVEANFNVDDNFEQIVMTAKR